MAFTPLIVVERDDDWPFANAGVDVMNARVYLEEGAQGRRVHVLNLCRSLGYQRLGYYVSLIADARGHRVTPTITTIQDLKSQSLKRLLADDASQDLDKLLSAREDASLRVMVFLGKALGSDLAQVAQLLFHLFPAPCFEAELVRDKAHHWRVATARAVPIAELPPELRPRAAEIAAAHFTSRARSRPKHRESPFELAVLHQPGDPEPPSDAEALRRFERAASEVGMSTTYITREDYSRLPRFDALFIRETTSVHHHTYRFARRAVAEGLVVIDDPVSIFRCTSKVYQAHAMRRARVGIPQTMLVHRGNIEAVIPALGLPVVLKAPDGAFSRAVRRADDAKEVAAAARDLLVRSDIIVAQAFVDSSFDWRVGVFDGMPIYACRYFMADGHWQVVRRTGDGRIVEGDHETVAVEDAPPDVVDTALRAAKAIGDGLYGVDLKVTKTGQVLVIEVNDNPSIEFGVEDTVAGAALYRTLMEGFVRRIERLRGVSRLP